MIEVVSKHLMQESDRYTSNNITKSIELMERAGRRVYEEVHWHDKILILCGTGSNAGDGYVIARLLHDDGYDVSLLLLEDKYSNDGAYYFKECVKRNIKYDYYNQSFNLDKYDMFVDCLLGTGFNKEVTGNLKDLILKVNELKKEVISVDINSGLFADNGMGDVIIKSSLTISIGYFKAGHFLAKAKDYIKNKINVDIGIKLVSKPYYLIEKDDIKDIFKERLNFSNKGTYGYISLMGGSDNYAGALKLANMASSASRSGAGVVRVCCIKSLVPYIMPNILESTVTSLKEIDGHIKYDIDDINMVMKNTKAISFGMGLGTSVDVIKTLEFLILNYTGVLTIDADGLNALAKMDKEILTKTKAKVIITPHLKEFSRLTSKDIDEINYNSISLAKEFADKYRIIVLLKGPTTIVTNGLEVYLVDKGCAGMATAGSGDVLSGILAALCASSDSDLLLTVASGAYLNGLAGMLAEKEVGDISLIASDTIKCIPLAIKKIRK